MCKNPDFHGFATFGRVKSFWKTGLSLTIVGWVVSCSKKPLPISTDTLLGDIVTKIVLSMDVLLTLTM